MGPSFLSCAARSLIAFSLVLIFSLTTRSAAAEAPGYDGVSLGMSQAAALQTVQGRTAFGVCSTEEAGGSDCLTYLLPGKSIDMRVTILFRNYTVQRIMIAPQGEGLKSDQYLCRLLFRSLEKGAERAFGERLREQVDVIDGFLVLESLWERNGRHARVRAGWNSETERCEKGLMEFVDAPLSAG